MVVAVLAIIVFVGVNWRLHDKGISMTSDYQCGLKEHKHTEECYKKVLICGKEETDGSEGHTHTDDCYKEVKKLTCDKEEHKHSAECYDEDGNLICGKKEHEHSDDCYTTEKKLVCGKKESEPVEAHHHTDACYKKELICDLPEHTHTAACYSDESADVEEKSDWEATIPVLSGNWAEDVVAVAQSQLGYEESTANFKLDEDGETRRGYTRYGDWYGNKYGDWSAMFASFCLNYAGIPSETVPVNSGANAWITELKEQKLYKTTDNYKPTAGDLVFLDTDSDGTADHVGIITETDKEDGEITSVKAIVGDSSDKVEENTYKIDEDVIIGYCALPENPDEKKAEEADKTDKKEADTDAAESTTAAEEKTTAEATTEESTKAEKSTEKSENKAESTEEAEKKTEEEKSSEATTENSNSTESTEESSEDELITESDPLVSVQKIDNVDSLAVAAQNTDEGVATQEETNTNEIDFGQYITSASLKKLNGNTWTDATEFQDGDQVKVRLEYEIPKDIVTADNPTITYQLPDGIKLNNVEQGIVSGTIDNVYYENLGNYTITKDGKISITFNDTFLQTNQKFTGHIEFQGTASNTDTGTNKDITFGADGTHYTIKPKPVDEDLTVHKEAVKLENGKVRYTITARSTNGTGTDKIKISDTLSYTGLNSEDVNIGTITVKDKNGNDVSGYTVSEIKEETGKKSFDITDLPALGKDESYTITYDVEYGQTIGNGFSSFNNTAAGYKGNDWKSQDNVYTELSKKMIEKSGWATDSNSNIQWTIKINPDKLTGVEGEYTLSDLLKENGNEMASNFANATDFTIKKTDSNWNTTDVTNTAYSNGKITIEDGCSYEITYKTPVSAGKANDKFTYNNTVDIDKDGKHYTDGDTVGVTIPSFLKKEGKETKEGSDTTAIADWKATLNLQYFDGDTIVYEDTLLDANKAVNSNIHYTTRKQLMDTLKLSCEVSNSNKEQKITNYTLTCYDENGAEVTADDVKVVSFKIQLTKPEYGKNLFVTYSTTMNTKDLAENAKMTVTNDGKFNGKEVNASNSYTNVKRLYKYGGRMDSNGNISYSSGDTTVDYEAQDGKLYYRIIVKPKDTNSFTITDTLPEGVTLDPNDVNVRIYQNDWNILDETWYDNTKYSIKDPENNIGISVDGREFKMTFDMQESLMKKLVKNTHGFCIDYAVTLSDSFWNNLKAGDTQKEYSNTVRWNSKQETQKTTVTRHTDTIAKTAEQVTGADGKITNRVKYYVTINPAGDKLNEGRNLTLTDTLKSQDATFDIRLSSVKLYSYNSKNKADHYKGQELSATSFTFQYDEDKKAFTAVVPDQTPCVLEQEYDIDCGDKTSVNLSNSVKLTGQDTSSSSNNISIKAASSSASATKGNVLEIIKVDSQHYQITLSNAQFRINSYKDSKWTEGNKTYTTGKNGAFSIEPDEITKNELYAVEETKAPDNYRKTEKQYYFVWLDNKTADAWWKDNGSNLKNKDGDSINKADIYFITGNSGTMMIPNQYGKLTVTKLWRDSDGNPTTDAGANEIKIKLKKAKQRPASAYNVTINYYYLGNNNEKILSKYSGNYVVKKGGKITITMMGGWNKDNIVSVPEGWTYQDNDNPVVVKSNEITQDNQVFEIVGNQWRRYEDIGKGNSFTVETTSPGYELETTDYQEITLSKQNNWTYNWDNLPMTEEDGTPIYYVVEEVNVPSGYTVSYAGNDGVQSGQISIINKKDKNSYTLPETGGSGTLPFIAVGATLMGFALLCGYSMRRRRGRRGE